MPPPATASAPGSAADSVAGDGEVRVEAGDVGAAEAGGTLACMGDVELGVKASSASGFEGFVVSGGMAGVDVDATVGGVGETVGENEARVAFLAAAHV